MQAAPAPTIQSIDRWLSWQISYRGNRSHGAVSLLYMRGRGPATLRAAEPRPWDDPAPKHPSVRGMDYFLVVVLACGSLAWRTASSSSLPAVNFTFLRAGTLIFSRV